MAQASRAPATLLVPARLGLHAEHCTSTRRLPPGICLTPAFRFRCTPCRFAAAHDLAASPARWPLPLHSVPRRDYSETGREDARIRSHASRIDFMQSGMFRDRADRGTCRWHLRSSGWHERNGQSLRCSFLRVWALALLHFSATRAIMFTLAPCTGTRSRRTPGDWVPAVSRLPTNPSDGPME